MMSKQQHLVQNDNNTECCNEAVGFGLHSSITATVSVA